MTTTQFDFEVKAPDAGREGRFVATVRVPLKEGTSANQVLHYIRSIQLKNDFMNGWVTKNAPNYGIEILGGPRPVFNEPGNRESGVAAYDQDFRLSRGF